MFINDIKDLAGMFINDSTEEVCKAICKYYPQDNPDAIFPCEQCKTCRQYKITMDIIEKLSKIDERKKVS